MPLAESAYILEHPEKQIAPIQSIRPNLGIQATPALRGPRALPRVSPRAVSRKKARHVQIETVMPG